eukprot:2693046-Lingulodinium_polyedra.AAC.1
MVGSRGGRPARASAGLVLPAALATPAADLLGSRGSGTRSPNSALPCSCAVRGRCRRGGAVACCCVPARRGRLA